MKSIYGILFFLAGSCATKPRANLVIFNAKIYTLDSAFSIAQAVAILEGKILAAGSTQDLLDKYEAADTVDAGGKPVYPGFIDAHAHLYAYGLSLQAVDLRGTASWEEVLERVKTFATTNTDAWLTGNGWDQNDWQVKEFPDNEELNRLFPDRPVLLSRIDGHAAIANQKALDIAGVRSEMTIRGGVVEARSNKLTGILIDNAIDLVGSRIPPITPATGKKALMAAQRNCFAAGLTTVTDCGLDYRVVEGMDSLHRAGELKMRIYAMLSDNKENYDYIFSRGKINTGRLTVNSFKVYADGALGSRGACLLQPYSDRSDWQGFLLSAPAHFDSIAGLLYRKNFQMCTHAIGDSGNRTILNVYAKYLKGRNDRRWRIEHAQVVDQEDFDLFGRYSIIPSVQPTHATSDMYWAEERLGPQRVQGAYAYKQLQQQNGWLPLGTDFPVEDISPIKTFYAAVVRKDSKGWPAGGYQIENALSRQDALRGMTVWAARANFQEKERGSIEPGKFADLVLLNDDLMTAGEDALLKVRVLMTIVNGEMVYRIK